MTSKTQANPGETTKNLNTDRPIEGADEDTLERAEGAHLFARSILALDSSHGLVVGVLGPWGSGKTSYINLARQTIRESGSPLVDFNPWMFSGIDRMVDAFFAEIASELKLLPQLKDAGAELEGYGELLSGMGWVPLVGPWTERARLAMRVLGAGLKKAKGGTSARRRQVERALGKLSRPVVVVLDDIDRLTTQEIRQVFQLVRLNASFPNLIYLLAFDRVRVEQALTEDGVPGRAYLEKILQLAIDLPAASPEILQSQIFASLDAVLASVQNVGELDASVWPDVYADIIRPLLTNMRDVRRYALAVRGTLVSLQGQVALADVLALEAVRVFMPDFFSAIPGSIDLLTRVSEGRSDRNADDDNKKAVQGLIDSAGDRTRIARAVLMQLFQASRRYLDNYHFGYDWKARWLRERRVGHESILRLYLERVASPPLKAHRAAERAFALFADGAALDRFLRSCDPALVEQVISCLEVFEGEYQPDHVVPSVVALLNFMPDIPKQPRRMFEFDRKMKVTRVTYRLLRSLSTPAEVERAVRLILPALKHLSLRWEVVSTVGHREGAGHRLITESASAALESEWRDCVRNATIEQLEGDPDLLRVLVIAQQSVGEGEAAVVTPDSPGITRRLLESALTETLSQSVESRAVTREPRLAWEALVRLFGGEPELEARVQRLSASGEPVDESLKMLVGKYLGGWRPEE